MATELATGYITIERNIIGATPTDLENRLGLPPTWLMRHGARVLVLQRQPAVGEFAIAGSTLVPDAEELVGLADRIKETRTLPHAWIGQRLVKVKAEIRWPKGSVFPRAVYPVEQWWLRAPIAAEVVAHISGSDTYWPRR